MKKARIFFSRFIAGFKVGAGFKQKIKAAFGLVFISQLQSLSFDMKWRGVTFSVFFKTGSDVAMWIEVFIDEVYQLPGNIRPQKIIDLGTNVGFSALYFSLLYQDAQIVALEPDPQNQEMLQRNLRGRSNVITKILAIGEVGGQRNLFTVPGQGMSSSFFSLQTSSKTKVRAVSLEELLNTLGWPQVDLIKFDIEGAEWETFKTAPLERIKVLIGEYHEDIISRPLEEFLGLFDRFKSKVKKNSTGRYGVLLHHENQKSL